MGAERPAPGVRFGTRTYRFDLAASPLTGRASEDLRPAEQPEARERRIRRCRRAGHLGEPPRSRAHARAAGAQFQRRHLPGANGRVGPGRDQRPARAAARADGAGRQLGAERSPPPAVALDLRGDLRRRGHPARHPGPGARGTVLGSPDSQYGLVQCLRCGSRPISMAMGIWICLPASSVPTCWPGMRTPTGPGASAPCTGDLQHDQRSLTGQPLPTSTETATST